MKSNRMNEKVWRTVATAAVAFCVLRMVARGKR